MPQHTSILAVVIFLSFVGFTLGLSFWLGRKAKTAGGYFAAHGQIGWFVNGIAFAGDYLSAASFLGICGMIAFYGYDGFLYSIGFLAGWVVALFVIAEPIKRLGKYTFADALDSKFNSPGIRLAAGLSTLVVSVFYLIPQMVGAGSLIVPLMGLPHWAGVCIVGGVVILIVTTAGMVSTTWVQFIKGSMLVVFCLLLVVLVLRRGIVAGQPPAEWQHHPTSEDGRTDFAGVGPLLTDMLPVTKDTATLLTIGKNDFVRLVSPDGVVRYRSVVGYRGGGAITAGMPGVFAAPYAPTLMRTPFVYPARSITRRLDGSVLLNGRPVAKDATPDLIKGYVSSTREDTPLSDSGPLGPLAFIDQFRGNIVSTLPGKAEIKEPDGSTTTLSFLGNGIYPVEAKLLQPGGSTTFSGVRSPELYKKLDFISLMLALFCGTASLPHILIRYYTVKDAAAARKSTVVGIAAIGFFYVLTLYIGLGAMVSGNLDPADSNMAAPLLARTFGELPFALITAIAFTTVLGTVSGLILAAAGAVAHDLAGVFAPGRLDGPGQVRVAKLASVAVGVIAIGLGIAFQKFNVTFLVGWAFNVAASGNLPAIVMLLFWRGTTKQGMVASILVGCLGSTAWLLLTKEAFVNVYGAPATSTGLMPFSQPGLVTIPLSFLVLVVVSLATKRREPRGFEVAI